MTRSLAAKKRQGQGLRPETGFTIEKSALPKLPGYPFLKSEQSHTAITYRVSC